jgi:hypothetical protein
MPGVKTAATVPSSEALPVTLMLEAASGFTCTT